MHINVPQKMEHFGAYEMQLEKSMLYGKKGEKIGYIIMMN